ncbi:MAG: hypothetical protein ACLT0Y_07370 [Christensenellales bacterium]
MKQGEKIGTVGKAPATPPTTQRICICVSVKGVAKDPIQYVKGNKAGFLLFLFAWRAVPKCLTCNAVPDDIIIS